VCAFAGVLVLAGDHDGSKKEITMTFTMRMAVSMALATAGLAVAVPSQADRKVYPGTFCEDILNVIGSSNLQYGGDQYVENLASGDNTVACPVVRDNVDKGVSDWDVSVDRRGNVSEWQVFLHSSDKEGDNYVTNPITVPIFPSNGVQHLDGGTVGNHLTEGMLYVKTLMPPGARLHRYHIDESD
jgi:hypothetical protein